MKSILTQLFLGELAPGERVLDQAPKLSKELHKFTLLDQELRDLLTPEQQELYERCKTQRYAADLMESTNHFRYGFRLGLLIALEVCQLNDRAMEDVTL